MSQTVGLPGAERVRALTEGWSLPLRTRAALCRTGILAGFLVVWEIAARTGLVDALFTSMPSAVAVALVDLATSEEVGQAVSQTIVNVASAFAIAVVAGGTVGILLGMSKRLRDAYLGPVLYVLSTPKVIFLPIFILVFGIGDAAGIAFGAFQAFFYIVVSVVGGVGLLEDRHRRVATAFRASPIHRFTDVIMPAALPGLVAALWHGINHALGGVLVKELFVSAGGIGTLIRSYTNNFDAGHVLALILVITVGALVAGSLWNRFEAWSARWRETGIGVTDPRG